MLLPCRSGDIAAVSVQTMPDTSVLSRGNTIQMTHAAFQIQTSVIILQILRNAHINPAERVNHITHASEINKHELLNVQTSE